MKVITLTTIFEGTIYSIEQPNTHLHRILYDDCRGTRINSAAQLNDHPNENHFKMGFNGCGVDYGVQGLLFGSGLELQYKQVETVVKEIIKAGNKVKLNIIGLSRGGIAGILLAKTLDRIDSFHLETNMLLLDPVPGNLSFTPKIDFSNVTLANQALNLSKSRNLNYVETLYPYLEVGDDTGVTTDQILANFHVPIRPSYPKHCEVKEEVILGAHLRAFQDLEINNEENLQYGVELIPIIKKLSKKIIYQFLSRVDSLALIELNDEMNGFDTAFKNDEDKWSEILQNIIINIIPNNRVLHSKDDSQIIVSNQAPYLNKIHRELKGEKLKTPDNLCLKIVPERVYMPVIKATLTKNVLLGLLQIIEDGMTAISQLGRKGELIQQIKASLEVNSVFSEEQLSFILRDIIAVSLQRDRNMFSFYNTTDSGLALINALNQQEFLSAKQCLKLDEKPVKYSDLSSYVLGEKNTSYFNCSNKEENLNPIEEKQCGDDGYTFLLH